MRNCFALFPFVFRSHILFIGYRFVQLFVNLNHGLSLSLFCNCLAEISSPSGWFVFIETVSMSSPPPNTVFFLQFSILFLALLSIGFCFRLLFANRYFFSFRSCDGIVLFIALLWTFTRFKLHLLGSQQIQVNRYLQQANVFLFEFRHDLFAQFVYGFFSLHCCVKFFFVNYDWFIFHCSNCRVLALNAQQNNSIFCKTFFFLFPTEVQHMNAWLSLFFV